MILKLYIGTDQLDLYKDEDIVVKSSIADSQDITKNTTDYSRSFTVPATDNNNNIFVHYYDADIDNTFDARIKVDGKIELGGVPFRSGKWRLSKVNVKKGKPDSYTIQFFGNLVSLKDKFGKDELKDLDLSAFEHDYTSDNVKTGLTSSLFSGNLIYNLLAKKRYYYNSDPDDNGFTDEIANIAFNGEDVGVLWNDLRPSIRLTSIIEAMETKYGITFSDDFFGMQEFTNLFLWCNNDDKQTIGGGTQRINWDSGDTTWVNLTTDTGTFPFQSTSASCDTQQWGWRIYITPEAGYETVEYTVSFFIDDEEEASETMVGTDNLAIPYNYSGEFIEKECYVTITTTQEFKYTARWRQRYIDTLTCVERNRYYNTYASLSTITSVFNPQIHLPKIKVLDFFKGLVNAFKLVVIPTTEDSIYINTLDRYYANGTIRDFTQYIDFESYDVERGDILNEIDFLFEDPQTILNKQFKLNTGVAYGDEETILFDDAGEVLDGTKLEVKLPFEQIVYERLRDATTNDVTNIMYGAVIDDKQEPTNIKPHIFYNIQETIGTYSIGFIEDDANIVELSGNINTPSHTNDFFGQAYSFLWSVEFNEWNGQATNNNLYSNYWQNYILSIFNIKRRNWTFNAKLPIYVLSALQLNDVIRIKQNYYRIDNFDLNLVNGDAKLKLINSFDNDLTTLSVEQTIYYIGYRAQDVTFTIKGNSNYLAQLVDWDYGTSFASISTNGRTVTVSMDENTGVLTRSIGIQINNLSKSQDEFFVIITQDYNEVFRMDFQNVQNLALNNILLTGKA